MAEFYFAYGSNMNPIRMAARDMQYDHAQLGILENYCLRFNKRASDLANAGYANVEPSEGENVEGILYRLTDSQQIYKMDPFEGVPTLYTRESMLIETSQEGAIESWVYVAHPQRIDNSLKPEAWYLDHLLAGKPYLTESYFEKLTRVEVQPNSIDADPW